MKNRIDARKLPAKTIEEKRRAAHKLRKIGITRAEIARVVGIHPDTVGRWLKLDEKSLALKKRGIKHGEQRLLSREQSEMIRRLVVNTTPDRLALDAALWTRASVKALIERETGVRLAVRTVGNYMKRWGITPQRPQKISGRRPALAGAGAAGMDTGSKNG